MAGVIFPNMDKTGTISSALGPIQSANPGGLLGKPLLLMVAYGQLAGQATVSGLPEVKTRL